MSRWYRAYAGTVKDDKLAEVSVIAVQALPKGKGGGWKVERF